MLKPFRRSRFKPKKLYLSTFNPQPRLEILLNQWIELYLMDTSMSLDRDGHSPEQIEYYNRERRVFFKKHGKDLLEYLQPYAAIPNGVMLFPDERRRTTARLRLLSESKKTETE